MLPEPSERATWLLEIDGELVKDGDGRPQVFDYERDSLSAFVTYARRQMLSESTD